MTATGTLLALGNKSPYIFAQLELRTKFIKWGLILFLVIFGILFLIHKIKE